MNQENGKLLLRKVEGAQTKTILVTHIDMLKNPERDFEAILSESDREKIRVDQQLLFLKQRNLSPSKLLYSSSLNPKANSEWLASKKKEKRRLDSEGSYSGGEEDE